MSDPFLAEIRILPFNFAPVGWASCNGQLLSISQNTALFSLLGTNYGGNGTSTFGLPNFQGMGAIGQGQGAGLSQRVVGETGGSSTVTLISSEIPAHTHLANAKPSANTADPSNLTWGNPATVKPAPKFYATTAGTGLVQMKNTALGITGNGLPHNNLIPYQVLNFCIAMQGIFPSRN